MSAITTSRLEGLTSGLRITHTAVPLNARHSRCPRVRNYNIEA
uniref:Uncharacterized protein n=1 Tax=Siphoviridae sp. ctBeL15 TaxID=2825374 RepID=A0A8S5V076_9CAUD|nr:MAG TPA: hypothetical protein [Siphoviridae sp. ctBeL15]